MHTREVTIGTRTYYAHHNSDFSGDVIIDCSDPKVESVTVPGDVFLAMIDQIFSSAMISFFEQVEMQAFLKEHL